MEMEMSAGGGLLTFWNEMTTMTMMTVPQVMAFSSSSSSSSLSGLFDPHLLSDHPVKPDFLLSLHHHLLLLVWSLLDGF
jgi:hypothetical protein